jgi:intracellular sulfur oxidation DsrE/DsrF family protein
MFWNTGVRLVVEGSWALGHLQDLENHGVEVLACGTCLDFFDLAEKQKVGKPTNMLKTIQSILASDMVCL